MKDKIEIIMKRYHYLKELRDNSDNFTEDHYIARLDEVMLILEILGVKVKL